MRIFLKPRFRRFARSEGISKASLQALVEQVEDGHADVPLGGGVYKQRLARSGEGKSGGYRTILYFKKGSRVFFVFGFAKSDQANIDLHTKNVCKHEAAILLELSDDQLDVLVNCGAFYEL